MGATCHPPASARAAWYASTTAASSNPFKLIAYALTASGDVDTGATASRADSKTAGAGSAKLKMIDSSRPFQETFGQSDIYSWLGYITIPAPGPSLAA
jgi:hypothetical protein